MSKPHRFSKLFGDWALSYAWLAVVWTMMLLGMTGAYQTPAWAYWAVLALYALWLTRRVYRCLDAWSRRKPAPVSNPDRRAGDRVEPGWARPDDTLHLREVHRRNRDI